MWTPRYFYVQDIDSFPSSCSNVKSQLRSNDVKISKKGYWKGYVLKHTMSIKMF